MSAGSIVAAAEAHAARLTAAGITATADPSWAATHLPCVLIAPPAVDYSRRLTTWRAVCLAGKPGGTLDALHELDELVGAVVDELGTVEAADPGSYQLSPDSAGTLPAYVLRFTT